MTDQYDEVLDLPADNHFQVPNMYVDDLVLYLTSDEFKVLVYMMRNISGRRTWRHHSLAISVFVNGRHLDKSFCVGIGMKEALVRKCLQSLAKFGFIEPLGKPTLMGQNWKMGSKIQMGALRKRLDDKLVLDVSKIQTARSKRGQSKDTPLVSQEGSCVTEPVLSDRTPGLLSHKTPPLLSDKTHRKTEERQKKDRKDIAPAIASAQPAPSTPDTSSVAGQDSARAEHAPKRTAKAKDKDAPLIPHVPPTPRAKSVLQRVIDDQWQHPYTGTPAPADSHDGVWRALLPQLMGNAAQKGRKEYNLSPAATEDEIYAFGKWYRRTNPDIPMPKSGEKLLLWFGQFRTCADYASRMTVAAHEMNILYRGASKKTPVEDRAPATITAGHPIAGFFAQHFPNEEQF
jgi:hypothetical protein